MEFLWRGPISPPRVWLVCTGALPQSCSETAISWLGHNRGGLELGRHNG